MSSGGAALSAALDKVNRKWLLMLVLGVAGLILVQKIMSPSVVVHPGMVAPDFALEATDGRIFTLSKLRGVPVILSFWGTGCPDCISELPGKNRFARAHPEVEVLGIAVDSGGLEALAAAKKEHGIAFPVLESNTEVETSYGVGSLPVTLLIDNQGVIQEVQQGTISKQKLTGWIL